MSKIFFIVLFLSIESMKKRRPKVVFHLRVINRNQPNGGDNYVSFVSIKIKFEAFRSYGSWKLYLIGVKKNCFELHVKNKTLFSFYENPDGKQF